MAIPAVGKRALVTLKRIAHAVGRKATIAPFRHLNLGIVIPFYLGFSVKQRVEFHALVLVLKPTSKFPPIVGIHHRVQ